MGEIESCKMRRLEARDIVPMVKILSKIGVNELSTSIRWDEINRLRKSLANEVKNAQEEAEDTETKGEPWVIGATVALDIANRVLENLPSCMDDVFILLSNVTGLEKAEIETMDFEVFTELIIDFIHKEEFRGFIGVVLKLLK